MSARLGILIVATLFVALVSWIPSAVGEVRWRGGAPDFTQYWLASVPLGGYVKMLDEGEGPVAGHSS